MLMGHVEALEVVLEALGLLDRIEIGALNILDQSCFENLLIVEVNDLDRNLAVADCLSGPQTPFAMVPAANQKSAALMSGAIVDEVDAGHFLWIEQPGSVAAATRRLLAGM